MAKYSNTVTYNLRTTLDDSGIAKLQAEIRQVQNEIQRLSSMDMLGKSQVNSAIGELDKLKRALNESFNANLGMLDTKKFSTAMKENGASISSLNTAFKTAGVQGEMAFNNLVGRLGKLDTGIKSVSKTTDKVFNTIGNTVRWGLIASGFQTIMNSAHQAVDYVKELDRSLNDIRIVSDYNAQQMRDFSLAANEAAKSLGQTTVAYTDASLIFAQQGYNLEDSEKLADLTLKVANTTQQSTAEVSEQLTSWINGYQMSLSELESTLDKVTKVAAVGASDTEELMSAATKVASTASTLGVTEDQLISQMSTIISVTREAPENVGNALKTIYARLGDLKMGETLEDGTSLGNLSGTLEKVGVQVLDDTGAMRSMGDVMEDLMAQWSNFDTGEKQALAVKLAGKYQYNRLMALMENAEMYEDTMEESFNSDGFLQRTQDIYMEGMQAKINALQAAGEGFISNMFNPDDMKPFLDSLTEALSLLTDMISAIGGGQTALTGLGAIATKVFSQQMARGINNMISNRAIEKARKENPEYSQQMLKGMGLEQESTESSSGKELINFANQMTPMSNILSTEQMEAYNTLLSESVTSVNNLATAEANLKQKVDATNQAYHLMGVDNIIKRREDGSYDANEFASNMIYNKEDFSIAQKELAGAGLNKLHTQIEQVGQKTGQLADEGMKLHQVLNTSQEEAGWNRVQDIFEQVVKEMTELSQQGLVAKNVANDLSVSLDKVYSAIDSGTTVQIEEAIDKFQKQVIDLKNTATQVSRGEFYQDIDVFNKDESQTSQAQSAVNAKFDEQKAMIDSTLNQQRINNIVNMAGAVGQLMFTWQSFQSLGSIWSQDDITTGEKLQQTILNMSMTAPMLISSLSEVNKVLGGSGFKQGITNVMQLATVQMQAKGAADAQRISQTALAVALESGTITTTKFSVALKGLLTSMPVLLGITVAIGALSAAWGNYEQSIKQAKEEEIELASSAKESSDAAVKSYNDWMTLYESYQSTGKATEELIENSKTIAESLEIEGANALIAAGNYDALAEAIKNKKDAELQETINANRGILDGQTGKSLRGEELFNGSIAADANAAFIKAQQDTIISGEGYSQIITNDYMKELLGDYSNFSSDNPAEIIGTTTQALERLREERDKLNDMSQEEKDDLGLDRWQSQVDELTTGITSLQGLLDQEDLAAAAQAFTDIANARIGQSDFQDQISQANSVDAISNIFATDKDTADAFKLVGDDYVKQLQYMISNVQDQTAQTLLQLEQIYTTSGRDLYGKITDLMDSGAFDYSSMGTSREESADDIVKYLQDQIKNSGLSEEEQLQFIASIDKDASLETILNQIKEIKDNPELRNSLEFKPTLTNRVDNDQEEIDSLLKETGMSENSFTRMSADMYNDDEGYFQNRADQIKSDIEAIENGSKSFSDVVSNAENAEDAIDQLKKEYGSLGSEAKDVAAANIRLNKGVRSLQDSWEDIAEVLSDDAAKGTADWYEAVAELDEAMSDILNIDVGTLSNDFYDNADAIDAMSRAAEGDMAAIDELRNIAAQDIITHMDIISVNGEDVEAVRAELLDLQQNLQATLDATPLEARADVDVSEYTNKLNEMIAAGQITAEQASAALSSMGVSGTLEYVEATGQVPKITYRTEGSIKNLLDGEGSGTFSVYPETTEMVPATVSVPQFVGTHYTGSGIASVGPKSSGKTGGNKGGGGKGGGGGGSGKTYEPKTKDPIEEDIDRYERIDTLLQAIENDFDKIAEEQDRLTGYQQADNMNKQIDLLQKQILLQKEKLEIQKEEAQELRDQLAAQYGVSFDGEGFISNYAATHRKLEAEVNSLINQYNATTSEEGQEALEKQIDAAQKKLDKFKEQYQRYDDLVSGDLKDTQKAIEDLKDSIEDLRIEAFKTAVEAADNIKDIQEKLIDFNAVFSGLGQDDPFRAMGTSVAKLKKYFDVATGSVNDYYDTLIARTKEQLANANITDSHKTWLQQQIAMMEKAKAAAGNQTMEEYGTGYLDMELLNLENIMAQIKQFEETGSSSIFGENSADLYEVAKDIFDSATDMIMEYEDQIEDLRDAILDAIDEIADKMDERREAYENITDELEHQADIIELLHGENAYEEINKVLSAQQKNYQTQIAEMQQQLNIWKDMQTAMEEGSEEWKAIQENITDTQKDLNDLVQDSLENLQQQYSNTINKIMDAWTNSAVGNDLDWVAQEWELINRNADYYLDQTNVAYAIQKLQGKYLELLDGSNDLHVQQQITEQMKEQLAYLREKKNISEYDVAYANAQLEILQKRIALEEAQKNKSQMKLKRDSQGNYGYVYTANQDDVAGAEGDLLDAQNNAYNLSKDQMKQTQDDSLSALQDAKNLINQIWNDANLTLEEKKKRTQTIIDSLKEYLAGTSEQLSTAEKNIINDFIGMVELMTDENAERLEDVYDQIINGNIDAFDQIDTRWSTSLTEWLQHMDEFNASTDSMFDGLIDNANNYQDQIDQVGDLVETDFNDMSDSIQNAVDKTNDLAASTSDFINQLKNDSGAIKEYENVLQEYANKIADVTNEMKAYKDQVNDLSNKLTAKEQENANLNSQVSDLQSQLDQYKNGSGSGGGGGSGSLADGAQVGDWVGFNGWYYYDSWGASPAGNHYSGQAGSVRIDNYSNTRYGGSARQTGGYDVHITGANGWDLGWVKESQLFDTGGYTGTWTDGSDTAKNGKLAWLHQKEIVLNQEDSYNILKAVNSVRAMTENLKSGAFDAIISRLNDQGSYLIDPNENKQDIEQHVDITATFPNVKSADEVEAAILSLTDQAVQYSFRN